MKFQKGQSGNPSGRPKIVMADGRSLRDLAREHTVAAVETLVRIMTDDEAPPAAQVQAASNILDRGWGKASQAVELTGAEGGPVETRIDLTGAPDEVVRYIAERAIDHDQH